MLMAFTWFSFRSLDQCSQKEKFIIRISCNITCFILKALIFAHDCLYKKSFKCVSCPHRSLKHLEDFQMLFRVCEKTIVGQLKKEHFQQHVESANF